jgi:hypothetical protein
MLPDLRLMSPAPDLSPASFKAALNTRFRVAGPAGSGTARSMTLAEYEQGRPSPEVEHFAVRFLGLGEPPFPQGTYHFSHDRIGAFELFIVPVGRQADGIVYEAVFNRLVGNDAELSES